MDGDARRIDPRVKDQSVELDWIRKNKTSHQRQRKKKRGAESFDGIFRVFWFGFPGGKQGWAGAVVWGDWFVVEPLDLMQKNSLIQEIERRGMKRKCQRLKIKTKDGLLDF